MAEVTTCSSFMNVPNSSIARAMSPNDLSNSSRNQSTPEVGELDGSEHNADCGATDLTVTSGSVVRPSSLPPQVSPSHLPTSTAAPALSSTHPLSLTIAPSITMTPLDEDDDDVEGDLDDDEDDNEVKAHHHFHHHRRRHQAVVDGSANMVDDDDDDDDDDDRLMDVIPNGLNIRFKSHSSALSAALLSLVAESYGTDVHLKCDHIHATIRAHRVVLAAF